MTDNPKVNIYIETSIHGISKHGGKCIYLIERFSPADEPETVKGMGAWRDRKETELALQALIAALARIEKPGDITIYSRCRAILSAIGTNGWIGAWKKRNWKTSAGKDPKYLDYWKRLDVLMQKHTIRSCDQKDYHNPYESWMLTELNRTF